MNRVLNHPVSADSDTKGLSTEVRQAEELLGLGEVRFAEELAQRLVVRALQLGQAHYRGVGYATLARILRARHQRHRFRIESLEALRHLDYDHDPDFFLEVVFDLSRDFLPNRPASSRLSKLVREIRERRTRSDQVPWSLFRWLEGRALQSRGRLPRAAAVLSGARRRCLKLEAARPAVAITLDLADAYLEAGRDRAARIAVCDTVRLVAELNLDADAHEAFLGYSEALVDASGDHGFDAEVERRAERVRKILLGDSSSFGKPGS